MLGWLAANPAGALMAGSASASPPDSPAARIDPNVAGSEFAGVGAILVNGGVFSGVVIASQYVLTAAHVGSGGPPSSLQFVLNLGPTPWTSGVESVAVYPTYSFPYDDPAVLKLSQPVPQGVPIYTIYGGSLATGLTLVLAGYGDSGYGDVGPTVGGSASVKRTGSNSYDAFTTTLDSSGLTSSFFLYDFDGPPATTGSGPYGGPTLGNTIETMVAPGDSGSPAFVRVAGSLQLFGISTFAFTTTNDPVTFTFDNGGGGIIVSDPRFASWLQSSTGLTLGPPQSSADAPLPWWHMGLLGIGLYSILAAVARNRSVGALVRRGDGR